MQPNLIAKDNTQAAQVSLQMAERRRKLAQIAMTCSAAMLRALENTAGVGE